MTSARTTISQPTPTVGQIYAHTTITESEYTESGVLTHHTRTTTTHYYKVQGVYDGQVHLGQLSLDKYHKMTWWYPYKHSEASFAAAVQQGWYGLVTLLPDAYTPRRWGDIYEVNLMP